MADCPSANPLSLHIHDCPMRKFLNSPIATASGGFPTKNRLLTAAVVVMVLLVAAYVVEIVISVPYSYDDQFTVPNAYNCINCD
jgi:hypothetical protein